MENVHKHESIRFAGLDDAQGIIIRLAVPADALDIADIHMRSWEVAYKDIIPANFIREKNATRPAQWQQVITAENTTYFVIQKYAKAVGFIGIDQARDDDLGDDSYELQAIYLHPDFFRQGIGTIAMSFIIDKARSLGNANIVVWVLADNIDSIRFYEKCGFTADGKSQDIEYGNILKVIRMRRLL